MNSLFTNPLAIILLLLLIAAVMILVVMRFDSLKDFFKQFVLVEDIQGAQNILDYADVLELLQREIKKSERYNFPICVILLEITKNASAKLDYLEALQQTVKRSIRETDVFGFYEPKEMPATSQFICVLPHTKFNEAYDLSERLRLKLLRRLSLSDDADSHLFDLGDLTITDLDVQDFAAIKDPNQHQINISCGVRELEYYEGIQLLIERTEEALEMAKIKNGNCTMPQPAIKEVVTPKVAKHLN